MGVSPMRARGILPLVVRETTAETAVERTGKMPVLRRDQLVRVGRGKEINARRKDGEGRETQSEWIRLDAIDGRDG